MFLKGIILRPISITLGRRESIVTLSSFLALDHTLCSRSTGLSETEWQNRTVKRVSECVNWRITKWTLDSKTFFTDFFRLFGPYKTFRNNKSIKKANTPTYLLCLFIINHQSQLYCCLIKWHSPVTPFNSVTPVMNVIPGTFQAKTAIRNLFNDLHTISCTFWSSILPQNAKKRSEKRQCREGDFQSHISKPRMVGCKWDSWKYLPKTWSRRMTGINCEVYRLVEAHPKSKCSDFERVRIPDLASL
jgi:hypothetical protein